MKKDTADRDLMLALTALFREQGFEGVSLSMIANATGLKRASLYYRFPGGKTDMALAVMDFTQSEFEEILAPLSDSGSVKKRIRDAARNIEEYYEGGSRSCLMDTLSISTQTEGHDIIAGRIAQSFEGFIGLFANVAREAGASPKEARRRGEDAVVRFEGSLVVARGTGDTGPFKRWLEELPNLLAGRRLIFCNSQTTLF